MVTKPRVLVVEDQDKLRASLEQGLTEEGYEVLVADTGETGFYMAVTQRPDAMILDRMLPGKDGVQILQELRQASIVIPILMLTARDSIDDRIVGLDAGADDYLVKPFDFGELLARLRALLRRRHGNRTFTLRADDLEVDLLSRRVVRGGDEIALSPREFELLEYLMRRSNRTVTRDDLSRDIWKDPAVLTNVIEVYVKQLRKKIERPGSKQLLCTIRGVGYVLRDEAPC